MCAVIGIFLRRVTTQDIDVVTRVIFESRIRGLHATGVSYVNAKGLQTIREPVPANEFLKTYPVQSFVDGNTLTMIAHCRYSTSDLTYNQPLYTDTLSVVHNGVISQELPENWERLYGCKTETKNDSELLLHSPNPLSDWKQASIAAIELRPNKDMRYYRNGKRPLYHAMLPNGVIVSSTADILRRASPDLCPQLIDQGTYYRLSDRHATTISIEPESHYQLKDLQPHAIC
jgi:glutamine phosphoribosylpyrophosphate amidotransferase